MNTLRSLIKRMTDGARSRGRQEPTAANPPPRDFTEERESDRVGNLSEEDQAWEAASRKRNRDTQARDQRPPGHG